MALPGESVSRRHAVLTAAPEGVRLSDVGSLNGTQLNGQPIGHSVRWLREGDVASIGDYTIRVEPALGEGGARRSVREGFLTLRTGSPVDQTFLTRGGIPPAARALRDEPQEENPQLALRALALARRLASGLELRSFLEEALACVTEVTGFEGGLLLRDDGGDFRVELSSLPSFCWSSTLLTAAVERGTTLCVNHLTDDPRFSAASSVVLAGHLRVLCAPLFAGEAVLGAIYLTTRSAQIPSQALVDFVTAVAHLAAAALVHQRRLAEVAEVSTLRIPVEGSPASCSPDRAIDEDTRALGGALQELARRVAATPSEGACSRMLEDAQHALHRLRGRLALVSHPTGGESRG